MTTSPPRSGAGGWRIVVTAAAFLAGVLGLAPGSIGTSVAATPTPLLSADYFGTANPANFWSSDMSGAPAAFAQMKSDGFNGVALVLPWGQFEPKVNPPVFDQQEFDRLNFLVRTAAKLNMSVVLRLSYDWDNDPADQMPGQARFLSAMANQRTYGSWLGYISRIHQDLAGFHNVKAAYISWEDFWFPVGVAQAAATPAQALAAAKTTGYLAWLRAHQSLSQVGATYGTRFASWSQVPTPPYNQPSFRLMYQYEDWLIVDHFFKPAQRRFPGLTMETRVDVDPVLSGQQTVGGYVHSAMYTLPGTSVTGMYFSPYMGDPSRSLAETATEGLAALRTTLSTMSSRTGGRPLYIYEYEISSNSPEVANDPNLTPNAIPAFLVGSEPILHHYTAGYTLWTYRDYNMNGLYNPSFALGTQGWQARGSVRTASSISRTDEATLSPGATLRQTIHGPNFPVPPGAPLQVEVQARAPGGHATVSVQIGSAPVHSIAVGSSWATSTFQLPSSDLGNAQVTLRAAGGRVELTDVQVYAFTQVGEVYTANGQPEAAVAPLTALNHELLAAGSP
ncbi:MAG: hypothetical protein ACYCU7_02370 [Acidimicrobiales bacterium]